jgi:plastocyanin
MRRIHVVTLLLCGVVASAIGCGRSPARRAETIRVVVDKIAFQQPDVRAHIGDSIEWINKDVVTHTSTARDETWDVTVDPGATGRAVLDRAGTFDYFCRLHPNMTARVVVEK